jgi:hypothetical protein
MPRNSAMQKRQAPARRRFGSECAAPEVSSPTTSRDCAADMIGPAVRCASNNLHAGEVVTLRFGREQARFLVMWVGGRGTNREGHVGLRSIDAGQYTWDVTVKGKAADGESQPAQPELQLCLPGECRPTD